VEVESGGWRRDVGVHNPLILYTLVNGHPMSLKNSLKMSEWIVDVIFAQYKPALPRHNPDGGRPSCTNRTEKEYYERKT
jgi:hypothetical protein